MGIARGRREEIWIIYTNFTENFRSSNNILLRSRGKCGILLSENRRKVFKGRDLTPNQGKKNEDVDYTLFDSLIEEFFNEEYDEETEYDYDLDIINETKTVLSFENFLIERY